MLIQSQAKTSSPTLTGYTCACNCLKRFSESSKDIKPHSDWVYLCMQLFKEVGLIVDSESSKDIKSHSDWVYLCMQMFKEVVFIVILSLTGSSHVVLLCKGRDRRLIQISLFLSKQANFEL